MQRHRFDPLSFAFGVIFTLLGLLFLVPANPRALIELLVDSLRWVWPVTILAIGAAILIPLTRREEDS